MSGAIMCDSCGKLDERTGRANYFGKQIKITVIWHGDMCRDCKSKKLLKLLNLHSEGIKWNMGDFL